MEMEHHIRKPSTTPHSRHSTLKTISFRRDRRGPCDWILNFLWLILGGWHLFGTWFLAGLILCLTCIGIPCGCQAIKISVFLLFPFGKTIAHKHETIDDEGMQCCFRGCNCLLNILWAVGVGWIFAVQALLTGIFLCLTIVGIPFGIQCFKLTLLCFCPFGIDFTAEDVETVVIEMPCSSLGSNFYAITDV
jgi:uncharacterized membrane protein YccF (DUF307 family)